MFGEITDKVKNENWKLQRKTKSKFCNLIFTKIKKSMHKYNSRFDPAEVTNSSYKIRKRNHLEESREQEKKNSEKWIQGVEDTVGILIGKNLKHQI